MKTSNQKLWTKSYILNLIAISAASITMTTLIPLLPIYIKMINGDISMAGIIVSIFTITALFFRPVTAFLIDKYGRKPLLITGMALIAISCFSYQYVVMLGMLMLVRVIHGIGYSSGSNAAGTIVADIVPKESRAQGIGYYGFITAASLALGPATGLMITNRAGINSAFLFTSCVAVVGLISAFFIDYDYTTLKKDMTGAKKKIWQSYEKSALSASALMALISFGYSGIMTYLAVYANSLGIHNISPFFIIYAVVLLFSRIIVDKLTKTRDISSVLLPGIFLMTVAFALLATAKYAAAFWIAAVFYALGYGSVLPALNTIAISLCAPQKRSAANSTFFSGLDLGIGLGAFVWGIISGLFGYSSIYYGCIVFMFLAAIMVILLWKWSKGNISLKL